MSETNQTGRQRTAPIDQHSGRIRERVAAGLALLIIGGTAGVVIASFWYLGNKDAFDRLKDLLSFVNPLAGVVLGYYFTKTSIESRAESAERSAESSAVNAEQANKRLDEVNKDFVQTREAMTDLVQKAPRPTPPTQDSGVMGGGTEDSKAERASIEYEIALQRAKNVLGIH